MRKLSLVIALLAAGCGSMMEPLQSHIDGQLALGKSFAFTPSTCSSGELRSFYGVDLGDRGGEASLRVAIDPIDGPRLLLMRGSSEMRFDRRYCETLDAKIEHTAWRINYVRDLRGTITLRCKTGEGETFEGSVRFDHCH